MKPTPVNMRNCQNITEKWICWNVWPANSDLFIYISPIASKQLNSLTIMVTFSWLGGAVVTHPLWVQEYPGLIPGSGKEFLCLIFCFGVVVFLLFVQNTLSVAQCCNSFCSVNLCSILSIMQDLWPIIRV